MVEAETTGQFENKDSHKNKVHGILAHSYLFCFISFLVGLFLDFIFPFEIFEKFTMASIGLVFLILGTLLIFWAQKASLNLKKENINKETFYHGPYRYTRSPTHFGIFLLMLGFGIMINALFVIIFSITSFIISKFTFLKKEEEVLAKKYGSPYVEYKKSVKF